MMQLIEWLKNLFGIDGNTAATIVITLTIFILGYFVNGTSNLISEFKKRRNYRKIFSDIIETVILNLSLQAKMFKNSSLILDIKNPDDIKIKTITITHLDNIDKLDFKDIYNSYFAGLENILGKKGLKAFNKIFGRLSLIKGIEGKLPQELSYFDSRFHENEIKFNVSINEVRKFTDMLSDKINGTELPNTHADYFQKQDTIILAWQKMETREFHHILKEFYLDPILANNREFQDLKFQGPNPILKLNDLLLDAVHHYDNMEKTLKIYSENLNAYSLTYSHTARIMKLALHKLV